MFSFLKFKKKEHEQAQKALESARDTRTKLNKKIEDLYAQLDDHGDDWFNELKKKKKEENNCN